MPVFDANLLFRSSGNLTQTETSSGIKVRGLGIEGLAVRVSIPTNTGTTNALLAKIQASDDNSTFFDIASYPSGAVSWASGAKEWIIPVVTDKKYVRLVLEASGSTGTPNWGVVVAGLVPQVGWDYTRAVDFAD